LSKNKLKRFKDLEAFDRVFQPGYEEVYKTDYVRKGKWAEEVFQNSNHITLELGCGKGEYTVNLARLFPDRNFIGIDIKGARMWKGAKTAQEENLNNVAFLRTRIEFLQSFFARDEVEEIWITFPDPQLKRKRNRKRLTAPRFLNTYREFLADNGLVHLKTDSEELHQYTRELVGLNKLQILKQTTDLYHSGFDDEILSFKTFYEKQFLGEGLKIKYISFQLPSQTQIEEIKDDEQE
jgi:tRNA (guanine-N7-)-methyltransferase